MAKIKVGIVGTGGMANAHAGSFAQMKGVELSSCLDVVPGRGEAFAEKHKVARVAKNIEELLDQVDAVAVVTPDRFHAPVSLQVLAAGKHLLCEKPLTLTLADARKVAQAAEKAGKKGVIHMVNFSYRRSAAFQKAIELTAKGALGEIRHVHSRYLQAWLASTAWGHWTGEALLWRLQTAKGSGGVLGDIGCHILDFTTAVAGDLARVRATLRTFPKIAADGKATTSHQGVALDANDSALVELDFSAGGLGICQTTRWATGRGNTVALEVHGTEGALSINLDEGYDKLQVCLGKDQQSHTWKTLELKPTPTNYHRFIRAIQRKKPDQPDIVRGAQIQSYLDACERSAKSQKWEKVLAWK